MLIIKNRFKIVLIVCLLLHLNVCQALVFVKDSSVKDIEFQAWLRYQKSSNFSYIQHYESLHPSPIEIKELVELFEEAQLAYLKQSIEIAHQAFIKVIEKAYLEDWAEKERQMIMVSFLRLAQISEGPEKTLWLKKSIEFDHTFNNNPMLFPPPLLQTWNDEKHRMESTFLEWKPFDQSKDFSSIKINGRNYNNNQKLIIVMPTKKQRVRFLSNSYRSVTYFEDPATLKKMILPLKPLAEGTCNDVHFNEHNSNTLFGVYFSESCIYKPKLFNEKLNTSPTVVIKDHKDNKDNSALSYNIESKIVNKDQNTYNSVDNNNNQNNQQIQKSSNHWLWVIGLVSIGFLFDQGRRQQEHKAISANHQ